MSESDQIKLLIERRSIRSYESTPIEDEILTNILETTRMCMSARNRQPWTFYVIKNRELIKKIAKECERLGYDSLWVMDHLLWGDLNEGSVFEAWTLLTGLAMETETIKLGPLVACNSFRNPTLTAKVASTFDVISKGRLIFGYGAGWKVEEYNAYGFPFRDGITRGKQLREGITLIKKFWTEEKTTFKGEYYEAKDAICKPKPVQKPHPPIMIGGGGEKYRGDH